MAKSNMKPVLFPWPVKGVNRAYAKNQQPQLTTPDALNVLSIEPNADRARGGQRAGTSKAYASQLGDGTSIRILGMSTVTTVGTPATSGGGEFSEVLFNKFFTGADGADVDDSEIDTALYNSVGETEVQSGVLNLGNVPGGGSSQPYALFTYDHAGQVGGTGPIYLFVDAGETEIINWGQAWVNSSTHYIPESNPANVYDADQYRVSCIFRARVGSSASFAPGGLHLYANMSGPFQDVPPAGSPFPANFVWLTWYTDSSGGMPAITVAAWTDDGGGYTDSAAAANTAIVDGRDYRVELIREGLTITARVVDTTTDAEVATTSITISSGEAAFLNGGTDQLSGFGLIARQYELDLVTEYTNPSNPGVSNFKVELYSSTGGETIETEAEPRINWLIVQAGEDIYTGTLSSLAALGSVSTLSKPSMTELLGKCYYVNGTDTKVITPTGTPSIADLTASDGTAPTGCRIACTWRGRLVLAQQDATPQNVYMSAAGNPLNWDYNPTPANELQAVALNASTAGRIGQPVKTLIPFRDDVLIIGADHSIYALVGDPAAGGVVTTISESIGMLQRDAWTIAPDGSIYFLGTQGLFRLAGPTSSPEELSAGKYEQFFTDLNRRGYYLQMQWDRDAGGCWIFATNIEAGGTSTHLWYDATFKAFWPMRFPDDQGPMASLLYDADSPTDRAIFLGGRDGYIRKLNPSATSDDGTAISSYCFIGPVNPFGIFGDGKLIELEAATGEGTTNLVYEIRAGKDAAAAFSAAYSYQLAWTTAGRQNKTRQRVSGNTFFLKLTNVMDANRWSIERVAGIFQPAGRVR